MTAATNLLVLLLLLLEAGSSHGQQTEDPRAILNLMVITPPSSSSGGGEDGSQTQRDGIMELVSEGNESYACRQSVPMPPGRISSNDSGSCKVGELEAARLALQGVNSNGTILRDHRLTITPLTAEVCESVVSEVKIVRYR